MGAWRDEEANRPQRHPRIRDEVCYPGVGVTSERGSDGGGPGDLALAWDRDLRGDVVGDLALA
jgi:hypothetical protein